MIFFNQEEEQENICIKAPQKHIEAASARLGKGIKLSNDVTTKQTLINLHQLDTNLYKFYQLLTSLSKLNNLWLHNLLEVHLFWI